MMHWTIAFVVHSTLWLGLAWLCALLRPRMNARVRERVWYTAIAACLITPTAQVYISPGTAFWQIPLPVNVVSDQPGEHRAAPSADNSASNGEHSRTEHSDAGVHRETTEASAAAPPYTLAGWQRPVQITWAIVSAILLLYYVGRLVALRRRIEPRDTVADTRAQDTLAGLGQQAGLSRTPRLTECDSLGSPIAIGMGRAAEVCVPTRAMYELDDQQMRALLAHEVAHHLRRDPLRLAALNILKAVFFFQPLLHVAVRQVLSAAEQRCDDWAAPRVDDRLALASCLAEVAAWMLPRDRRLPVPCMARGRSQLRVRVEHLLQDDAGLESTRWVPGALASVVLLVLACGLAPAMTPAAEVAGESHERQRLSEPEHRDNAPEHAPRYRDSEHSDRAEVEDADEHGEPTRTPAGEHQTEQKDTRGHR